MTKNNDLSKINLDVYTDIAKTTSIQIKPTYITIHTTGRFSKNSAETYVEGTKKGLMGSALPHFYVDENKAINCGHLDRIAYHSGDTKDKTGGNYNSIGIECCASNIYDNQTKKAIENTAKLTAILCTVYNIPLSNVVTHTYWVNHTENLDQKDKDKQSTNLVLNKKWCPLYIFRSNNELVAFTNWIAFKHKVSKYMLELSLDINGDGVADEKDGVALSRFLAGYKANFDLARADLNNDDKINEKDVVILSRWLAGWEI